MSFLQKCLYLVCALLAGWLTVRFALPVLLPFLLGGLLAMAAEPVVRFATDRWHFPRWAGAGIGVSMTLLVLASLLWLLASALVKEVSMLAQALPDLQDTAREGLNILQSKAVSLSQRMPAGLGKVLSGSISSLSGNGSAFLEQTALRLPGFLGSAVGKMSQSFISLGTGVLSAFLISSRLPLLRGSIRKILPESWETRVLPAMHRIRKTLGGWLKAQGILLLITYGIICIGFLLLQIPYGPVWALLIAIVDAVPMLGTGIILLPWALIRLLQGWPLQALGLACIFAVCAIVRSVLEPKLVGRHIGLDPLLTLFSMYAGFRFFGLWGLILAPMVAAAAKAAVTSVP